MYPAILSVFDPLLLIERFHMRLALFTASRIFAPLHEAIRRLVPGTPHNAWLRPPAARQLKQVTIIPIAPRPRVTRASTRNHSNPGTHRPLRVLRVVETSAARACAGRMVISGRMTDVCAELERLAASEVILH
jgi:hypothetical protein